MQCDIGCCSYEESTYLSEPASLIGIEETICAVEGCSWGVADVDTSVLHGVAGGEVEVELDFVVLHYRNKDT